MNLNIKELREILKNKETGFIAIPNIDYIKENKELIDNICQFVRFDIYDDEDILTLEFSENGINFNKDCDWIITINSKGKIKGNGSIKQRENIIFCVDWLLKAVYDNRYNEMFKYSPMKSF